MAKTNNQTQADYRNRRIEAGLSMVTIWLPRGDKEARQRARQFEKEEHKKAGIKI